MRRSQGDEELRSDLLLWSRRRTPVLIQLSVYVSQVGFRKGGVDFLGRRTQLEVLLAVLLLVVLLALLACLLLLGLGSTFGKKQKKCSLL